MTDDGCVPEGVFLGRSAPPSATAGAMGFGRVNLNRVGALP